MEMCCRTGIYDIGRWPSYKGLGDRAIPWRYGLPERIVISIDGPGGSGKSTIARRLAQRLSFSFLDSGAIYRAATWYALNQDIPLEFEAELLQALDDFCLRLEESPEGMRVFVNLNEITREIRQRDVSNNIFHLANNEKVRERLVAIQRDYAEGKCIVTEGRDMGTVVFPDADLKFFLIAGLDVRAQRRKLELDEAGETVDLDTLKNEIRKRDERDETRAVAPLRKPDDALVVDSSSLSTDEVLERMIQEIRARNLVNG